MTGRPKVKSKANHRCSKCKNVFATKWDCLQHARTQHPDANVVPEPTFQCEVSNASKRVLSQYFSSPKPISDEPVVSPYFSAPKSDKPNDDIQRQQQDDDDFDDSHESASDGSLSPYSKHVNEAITHSSTLPDDFNLKQYLDQKFSELANLIKKPDNGECTIL